jgi:diguanylate cyclase (GGDEF)-like protein
MNVESAPSGTVRQPRLIADALGAAAAMADGLLERRGPSVARRLSARELRAELIMALAFAAAAAAILVGLRSGRALDPLSAALLVATYALVARVKFALGPGLVRPTQLVFVPMLFLLPAPAVPLLVAAAGVISALPEIGRRDALPERMLVAVADCWYSIGPALLIGLVGAGEPSGAAWSVYLLALGAQFAGDLSASTLREWLGAGIPPAALAQVLALVYLVDALLAPIGLLAVLATSAYPYAYLLAVPPGALLALIARERGKRIERELQLGRAHRRSARRLAAQADDLRRQADQLQRAHRRVGDAVASTLDRGALERLLLTTTIEAVQADGGRLSARTPDGPPVARLAAGALQGCEDALRAAEAALCADPQPWQVTVGEATALAIPLGGPPPGDRRRGTDMLTVARSGAAFSAAERELIEHLAAQTAVSLENLDLHELVQRQAVTDELTGLLNHRRLQQVLAQALSDADRTRQPVALVMIDIDDFKRVNDTHGHQQGDRVLREVARVLQAESRPHDHAGRYGGEELALVLPATTLDAAAVVAERVRQAIGALSLALPAGGTIAITASLGIAAAPDCARDREALIEAADGALYAAKHAGKNQTAHAPATPSPRPRRFEPGRAAPSGRPDTPRALKPATGRPD